MLSGVVFVLGIVLRLAGFRYCAVWRCRGVWKSDFDYVSWDLSGVVLRKKIMAVLFESVWNVGMSWVWRKFEVMYFGGCVVANL